MNKKLLIAGAIATALVLTACVKKEEPKEPEQETTTEEVQQPVQVDPVEPTEVEIPPAPVSVEHQESNNTSATITREYRDAPAAQESTPAPNPVPKAEPKSVVEKPTPSPKANSETGQSEDDAVAAAIAAATPALDN